MEEVSNPRRVLAVSLDSQAAHLGAFIKELTGKVPEPADPESSLAGTTHDLSLATRYYRATVPVWLDLIAAGTARNDKQGTDATTARAVDPVASRTTAAADWAASFLSDEAREVLDVLGAVVVVFAVPPTEATATRTAATQVTSTATGTTNTPAAAGQGCRTVGRFPNGTDSTSPDAAQQVKELVHHVGRVLGDGLGGWEWDGVRIAIGVGGPPLSTSDGVDEDHGVAAEWDEICAEAGMEYVHLPSWAAASAPGGRNEFGEKSGMERVREALEANDWEGDGMDEFGAFEGTDSEVDDNASLDPESLDFGFDRADFEGLKKAIWSSGVEPGEGNSTSDAPGATAGNATSDVQTQDGRAHTHSPPQKGQDIEGEALDEDDVAKVERMMRKLQAAREAGQGMNEAQRKRMAARAVAEVMREL
ncbi:hypothetical protein JDV02_005783 [Purpureocillium takamizusanense]|uniref:Alpha and gamma adaptin binding protein p34 n=1 Tax=Purpureocillium takamizusanense TaxID=2060973 RepID=A0A9Q8QIU9_9HYPO|nr:uncharacterized protein JDV02_005783 [Purpureocillium takamizusanense]UNI19604.1 hypothetical protein JDV02_005783 [Purpureocillium takamizusanense]